MNEIWQQLFHPEDSNEKIICVLGWLVVAIILGLIIWGVLSAIDSMWVPVEKGTGLITEMRFIPSHHTTILVYNGKTTTPVTTWHPDAWKIVIERNGIKADWYVKESEYLAHKAGESVSIEFKSGRIWRTMYLVSVR